MAVILGGGTAFALLTTTQITKAQSTAVVGPSPASTIPAPEIPVSGGPAPGTGGFDSVTCPSTSLCIAVGGDPSGGGLAEVSSDFGATWTTEALATGTPELDAVSCVSTTDCVAVGPGVALSTFDGGTTWSTHSLPVGNTTLLGVSCSPSLACVAVGIAPNTVGPTSGEVAVSGDGGATWSAGSVPGGTPGLESVTCPTATHCLAVGATILVSDDAGATWQQRPVNGGMVPLSSIACSSATVCVAVGSNPMGVMNPSAGDAAVISTDGGATWSAEPFPTATAWVGQIACDRQGSCYASGEPPNGAQPTFLGSTDGGSTWAAAAVPPLTSVASIDCTNATECVAVGQQSSSPASAITTNGTTWTPSTVGAA